MRIKVILTLAALATFTLANLVVLIPTAHRPRQSWYLADFDDMATSYSALI
jgi:hypothetical protein